MPLMRSRQIYDTFYSRYIPINMQIIWTLLLLGIKWSPHQEYNISHKIYIIFTQGQFHLVSDTYLCWWTWSSMDPLMACRLFDVKPLSKPLLPYCQLDHEKHTLKIFYSRFKMYLKLSSVKWHPFCLGRNVLRAYPVQTDNWLLG